MRVLNPVSRLDARMLGWVVRSRRRPLDRLFTGLSQLGRGGVVWLPLLAASARRPAARRDVAAGAFAVLSAYAASLLIARVVQRTRPCDDRTAVPLVKCPSGPSFPSDQAAAAAAGAVSLAALQSPVGGAAPALAAAIGYARVYVGAHYPGDVLAGAALGAASAAAARALAARIPF